MELDQKFDRVLSPCNQPNSSPQTYCDLSATTSASRSSRVSLHWGGSANRDGKIRIEFRAKPPQVCPHHQQAAAASSSPPPIFSFPFAISPPSSTGYKACSVAYLQIFANFCSNRSVLIPLQRQAPLKQSVIASTHTHTRTQYQPKHFLSSVCDTVSSDRCCRVSCQKTACQIQNGRDATSAFHLRIHDCPCKLIHLGARGCVYVCVCVWLRGLPCSNFTTAQQGPHTHHHYDHYHCHYLLLLLPPNKASKHPRHQKAAPFTTRDPFCFGASTLALFLSNVL